MEIHFKKGDTSVNNDIEFSKFSFVFLRICGIYIMLGNTSFLLLVFKMNALSEGF